MKHLIIVFVLILLGLAACQTDQALPILGNHDIDGQDTIYHSIPDFNFINQDSIQVTNATFAGKAYVVDFFFTSCPTICPKVKKNMLRLYDKYENEDRLALLSHTIDVKRDTVGRLKTYAENLGVNAERWHFVTGDKDAIYTIAEDYMSLALEDPSAPGGFNHSGWLILVDDQKHIRSFCNGTDPKAVDEFMKDIDWLLAHM